MYATRFSTTGLDKRKRVWILGKQFLVIARKPVIS